MMKYVFDKITHKPLIVVNGLVQDEIEKDYFYYTEERAMFFVELPKFAYDKLLPEFKKIYSEEFSTELTMPIIERINEELKKHGI